MSNPEITEAPEETPYMGMTEEEKGIQFAQDEERRAVMRVMFASVFGEEEVMKDDVKRTLDMMGIEEDDMSDLQDIGDAMMENLEAARRTKRWRPSCTRRPIGTLKLGRRDVVELCVVL